MKIYYKIILFFNKLMNTLISIIKLIIVSGFRRSNLPNNTNLSCVILGNGPSLNQSLIKYKKAINKYNLICVNHFASTTEYVLLKPSYYVMLDPAFWSNNPLPSVTKCLYHLQHDTAWPIHLLVPTQAKKSICFTELVLKNTNLTITYYNYTAFKGFDKIAHYLFKNKRAFPQCQNILVLSIFLAINMKFKNIFILGADHDWHTNLFVNNNNQLCLNNNHFYSTNKVVEILYNDDSKTTTSTLHEALNSASKAFLGHFTVAKYAKYCGANIYNASECSMIDSYERKDIN